MFVTLTDVLGATVRSEWLSSGPADWQAGFQVGKQVTELICWWEGWSLCAYITKCLITLTVLFSFIRCFTTSLILLCDATLTKAAHELVVDGLSVCLSQEEVSAATAVYVILVALLLPFILTRAHLLLSHLVVVWTCLIILAKMLYQLQLVPVFHTSVCDAVSVCTHML